jgi:hypothetical protein
MGNKIIEEKYGQLLHLAARLKQNISGVYWYFLHSNQNKLEGEVKKWVKIYF